VVGPYCFGKSGVRTKKARYYAEQSMNSFVSLSLWERVRADMLLPTPRFNLPYKYQVSVLPFHAYVYNGLTKTITGR
jgi:hypothetical protein